MISAERATLAELVPRCAGCHKATWASRRYSLTHPRDKLPQLTRHATLGDQLALNQRHPGQVFPPLQCDAAAGKINSSWRPHKIHHHYSSSFLDRATTHSAHPLCCASLQLCPVQSNPSQQDPSRPAGFPPEKEISGSGSEDRHATASSFQP